MKERVLSCFMYVLFLLVTIGNANEALLHAEIKTHIDA
jgi:hypothetical protein